MLPWLIHPLSHKFILLQYRGIVSIVAINNVVCTVHIIRSALLPLLLLPLLCWVTGFCLRLRSLQLRFEEDDSGEGLLLGLAALLDDDDVDC
jgi:hypothetical protein